MLTPINAQEISPAQKLFDQVIQIIKENYNGVSIFDIADIEDRYQQKLDRLCIDKLITCPIDYFGDLLLTTMVGELLDLHTFLIHRGQVELEKRDFNGENTAQFGLITAQIANRTALVVQYVREDGPAHQIGIRPGDVITAINGQKPPINFSQRIDLIQEPVEMNVLKPDGTEKTLSLNPMQLGPWLPQLQITQEDIGIITIFQLKTMDKVAQSVHDLIKKAKSVGVKGLILDLRSCLGGLTTEQLAVTGIFIQQPTIFRAYKNEKISFSYENDSGSVIMKNQDGSHSEVLTIKNPQFWSGPMVVLTNHDTGSAPEYVAFLLQQAGRTKVIGESTFGVLNTSTNIFGLLDGSYLVLTTAISMTKDGKIFPDRVQPDIYVADSPEKLDQDHDPIVEIALNELRKLILPDK